ncbi:MAG: glycerophosphodiester phosphodiesterase [Halobacteriales archaeon]
MVRVVGHRGASGYAPENTLAAFERAVELDADVIEFDVRTSADDELMIIHDDTVDEVTDGSGAVNDLTKDELQALDAGDGAYIPTYDETLRFMADHDVDLRVEPKELGIGERILAGLKEYGLEDRTSVVSFDPEAIAEITEADPETPIDKSFTTGDPPDEELFEAAEELGVSWIAVNSDAADQELVDDIQDRGYIAELWVVDDPDEIETVLSYDPDYVCSNYPDRVLEQL